MVFTSPKFFLFLGVILLLLRLVPGHRSQKLVLTFGSCFFYAAWDWRYLGLLLFISWIDFVAGAKISASSVDSVRRRWMWLSMGSNLCVLGYFKYCNFFIDNLRGLLQVSPEAMPSLNVLLPAGISFYTFKTMSYTIDVYRREIRPVDSWLDYFMFVTFFPELIAGPIVRASVFLPQMDRNYTPTWDRIRTGASIFLQGMVKKWLIADRLAISVDAVFAQPELYSSASLWCALLAYSIQIYCDFAGYSDMAVGTARMMGFELPENFRMPYLSRNVAEFWRRWHITLSTWLRDYLYIPLGGNRHGDTRTMVNLMLTMLLGGLWHGASWAFVLWGGLHGLALAVHRLWSAGPGKTWKLPGWLAWFITLFFIILTWVPFRAETSQDVQLIYARLFGLHGNVGVLYIPDAFWIALAAILLGHAIGSWIDGKVDRKTGLHQKSKLMDWLGCDIAWSEISGPYAEMRHTRLLGAYVVGVVLLLLAFFAPMNTNPFIYFQF